MHVKISNTSRQLDGGWWKGWLFGLSLSRTLSHPFAALIAVECSIANPFSPKEISRKPAWTNVCWVSMGTYHSSRTLPHQLRGALQGWNRVEFIFMPHQLFDTFQPITVWHVVPYGRVGSWHARLRLFEVVAEIAPVWELQLQNTRDPFFLLLIIHAGGAKILGNLETWDQWPRLLSTDIRLRLCLIIERGWDHNYFWKRRERGHSCRCSSSGRNCRP